MVTVIYKVLTKQNKEKQFEEVAIKCEEIARSSKDCIYYSFFRSLSNPREFVVYYRFSSKEAQDKHTEKLQKALGPAPDKRHAEVEEDEVRHGVVGDAKELLALRGDKDVVFESLKYYRGSQAPPLVRVGHEYVLGKGRYHRPPFGTGGFALII